MKFATKRQNNPLCTLSIEKPSSNIDQDDVQDDTEDSVTNSEPAADLLVDPPVDTGGGSTTSMVIFQNNPNANLLPSSDLIDQIVRENT